jgi:hypothetical protein
MADVISFAGTGVTYKNGTATVYADKLGNTKKVNARIEHNVIVSQSGILNTRFDDCGPSGSYYFA